MRRFKTPDEAVAWLKDEPREDVEALETALTWIPQPYRDQAFLKLAALLARLEQTERVEESLKQMLAAATIKRDEYQARAEAAERERDELRENEKDWSDQARRLYERIEAAERALREIKTYTESCRDNYGFPSTVRLLDITDAALASSEGEE